MIAVLLLSERQDFQQEQASLAREASTREGVPIEIAFADNSPFAQIQQVLAYIRRPLDTRPTAIIAELAGAAEAYTTVARSALAAGVGWVDLSPAGSTLQPLRAEFPGRLAIAIGTDEVAIGRIHAHQCRAFLPDGGGILYVEGPGLQREVKARRNGFEEGIRESRITIAKTLAADWTADGAERAASAWLAGPSSHRTTPSLVCAQNDSMAMGVRRAAIAKRVCWAESPFIGCDGLPKQGQRFVKEGALAATIIKPVTAGLGVQCAARAVRGVLSTQDVVLVPQPYPEFQPQ